LNGKSSTHKEGTMTDAQDLLLDAYRGEVFGEAFFGALAAREADPGRLAKLRALQTIESRTAAALREYATRVSAELGGGDESRREGEELGAKTAEVDWSDFVRGLHDSLPSFLANFVRLREMSRDPHDDALQALVAHEQTINAFAELELAGHTELSLPILQRYLESTPPRGAGVQIAD
jgi:hypothetical protein